MAGDAMPTQTPEGVSYNASAPADAPKGECISVDVEKTANGGYTARCRYRQPQNKRGDDSPYVDPETYAFSSFAELVSQLASAFGESAPGAPPQQQAPAGPMSDITTEQAG